MNITSIMARWKYSVIFILFIMHHIGRCDDIYESITNSLDGLKNYAADILPYLHKGVKMVQKAEKFVDSAIGEDCTYECAKEGLDLFFATGDLV